jgi:putative oxidoreductase
MLDAFGKNVLAPLLLRLVLAAIFVIHGMAKVNPNYNWGGSAWADVDWANRHEAVPEPLQSQAAQLAVAWGELVGGVALALGLLTRLAALGLTVIQAGAIGFVTYYHGFAPERGVGYQFNVALLGMLLALLCLGGGALSVDRLLWRKKPLPAPAK